MSLIIFRIVGRVAAGQDRSAARAGIFNVLADSFQPCLIDHWPHIGVWFGDPICGNAQLTSAIGKALCKHLKILSLDKNAVHTNAYLSGMRESAAQSLRYSNIQIGVITHDEGRTATKFQDR